MRFPKIYPLARWVGVGSLFLGLIVGSSQAVVAASPIVSWTDQNSAPLPGPSVNQLINGSVVLNFHLTNPSSSTVVFTSSGVGAISASAHTSGFMDLAPVPSSTPPPTPTPIAYPVLTYAVTADNSGEDIESITVSSNLAGAQTLTATTIDSASGLVIQNLHVSLTWVLTNFKIHVTAGSRIASGVRAEFNTVDLVTKFTTHQSALTDSLGEVNLNLPDGRTTVNIYNYGSDATQYVSTFFTVTAIGGQIILVTDSSNLAISPDSVSGIYPLQFPPANVQGNFTIGGVPQAGNISGVYDLTSGINRPIEASAINGGQYGMHLPVGSYRILLQPIDGISVPVVCNVTSDPMTTCDETASANNFRFELDDKTGNPVTAGAGYAVVASNYSSPVLGNVSHLDSLWNISPNNSYYLADGTYTIEIHAKDENLLGGSRKYNFTVSAGLISNLIDISDGVNAVVDPNGMIHLQLLAPNFVAHVNANATAESGVSIYSSQSNDPGNIFFRSAFTDISGTANLTLPNGLNTITLNPTGLETPTVVSATYNVLVSNGVVQTVSRDSGETLTAGVDAAYTLDFATPNILGSLTLNGAPFAGWISGAWNTVLNIQVPFQQSRDGNGNFGILVPAGNYDFLIVDKSGAISGVQNCTASASIVTRCDVNFPANNLILNLEDSSGAQLATPTSGTITRQNVGGQSFTSPWFGIPVATNSSGQLQTSLLDAKYTIHILSGNPAVDGVGRTFNFSVTSGVASTLEDVVTGETITASTAGFLVPLAVPNLKGVVIANGVADPQVSYNISGISNLKIAFTASGISDANGYLAEKLPDGSYNLQVPPASESPTVVNGNFKFNITGGILNDFKDLDGVSVAQIGDTYQLNLLPANVTGSISVGGTLATNKNIYIQGIYSLDAQKWADLQFSGNQWVNSKYSLRVAAGNYLIALNENGKASVFLPCQVAPAGISNCDLAIPTDNFKFKVAATDGSDLLTNVGSSGNLILQNTSSGFWLQMGSAGLFSTPLQIPTGMTGYYQLQVYPNDGSARHGVLTSYKVELAADGLTVETVTSQATGEIIMPNVDGVYGLKLTSANISGTVVTPDGKTPVPNALACAQGQNYGTCMWTDSSGAFAARTKFDGTYQVFAQPPTFDMTKAESDRATMVIVGGVSTPASVTLALRIPNVTGLVHGPDGIRISPNNYLQVLKDDGSGNFNYVGWDVAVGRATDSTGHFAFHLDPGKYKFHAQGDEVNSGGSATVSSVCEVFNTTDSYNCSFSLNTSNVKLQILGQGGKPDPNAYVNFSYAGSKLGSGKMPAKTWDFGQTDIVGQTKTYLEDGTWNARVQPFGTGSEAPIDLVITVDAGLVTSIVDNSGNVFVLGSDGFFQIQLPISNLVGIITSDGKQVNYWSQVYLLQDNGNYYNVLSSQGFGNGKFSFFAAPGTYAIQVIPYPNTTYSAGTPVSTRLANCVVPTTGQASCDVALRTGNLLGKIVTPSGNSTSDTYAYVNPSNNLTSISQKISGLDWIMSVYSGQFSVHLDPGEHNLVVNPGGKSSSGYTPRTFKIVVDSAQTIISVTDLTNGLPVNPDSSGRYSFQLSVATVTGKVFRVGSTTQTVPYAQIVPLDPITGNELWQYSTQSNYLGDYAISLPDGTFNLRAKTYGWYGEGVGTSESQTVTVAGQVLTSGGPNPVNFQMRAPNFTVKVVMPRATIAVPNIYVSGTFNGQYFGGATNSAGIFAAFVDTSTATICNAGLNCQITVYPINNPNYSQAVCPITAIDGTQQICEIGEVTSHLTIRVPTNGGTGLPNKWSWASVEEFLNETNTVIARTGYGANALGQIGLGLVAGHHYSITAYPSGDYYDRFSPKTLTIPNFDPATQANLDLTFDSPNITFVVSDRNGVGNSWGWFEVQKKDGTGQFSKYGNGYLNGQGRGAQYLPDGDYQIAFYPGKAIGVVKEFKFTVSTLGSVTTITDELGNKLPSSVMNIVLGSGNVTGTVISGGLPIANIPITATVVGDSSTVVATVTKDDGTYELNLDTSKSWSISALDPLSASLVTLPDLVASFITATENILLS